MRLMGLIVLAAVGVSACGDESVTSTTEVVAPTSSAETTAPVTTSPPAATTVPEPTTTTPITTTSTSTTTTTTTTATTVPTASCGTDVLLATLIDLFPSVDIADVSVADCVNGHARVWAIPDMSSCPDPSVPCMESEQVFLRDDAGEWVYVDSGTGIECTDAAGLLPETIAACDALGLT